MLISANNITQKKTQTDKLLESIYIGLKDKRFYALAPETCDPDVYLTVHKLAKSNTKQFRGTNHLFLIIIQLFTRVIHFFRGNIHSCFGNIPSGLGENPFCFGNILSRPGKNLFSFGNILSGFGKNLFCFGNIPLFPSINVSLSRKNRHFLEIFPPFPRSLSLNLLCTHPIVQRSDEMNLLTFKTL
jgi:hypothetical protein